MRGLVLDAYFVALRCALPRALDRWSLPVVLRFLTPRRARWSPLRAGVALARSERAARALRVADTCFYRSMVRWTALRRAGIPATFVMGVRRDEPETGHAWVEIDGEPVGEARDARLVPTFRFP